MIRGRKSPVVHILAYRKSKEKSDILLAVTPDVLDMTEYPRGIHVITWKIDTKGYHFPKEGPAIEFTSPGWQESFRDFKVSGCGRIVTAINLNRDGLAYAYNINVVEVATGMKAFLDPIVGNSTH